MSLYLLYPGNDWLVQSACCNLHLLQVHVDEKYWPMGHALTGEKQLTHVAVSSADLPLQAFCSRLLAGHDVTLRAQCQKRREDCLATIFVTCSLHTWTRPETPGPCPCRSG